MATVVEWTTAARTHVETGSIVIAVDGGPGSSAALRWIVAHSGQPEPRIVLVTVATLTSSAPVRPDGMHERVLRESERLLRTMLPHARLSCLVCEGDALEEICEVARGARLLVIGSHVTGSELFHVSGLAAKVAAHASVPVVVVPHDWVPRPGPVVTGVSTDAASDAAVDFAIDFAEREDRDLVLAHAWELPGAGEADLPPTSVVWGIPQRQQAAIELRAAQVRPTTTVTVSTAVATGQTAKALTTLAQGATLLVVGRRPRAALTRLLFGSVSRDAVLAARCPVAVVPAPTEPIDIAPDFPGEDL